MLTRVGEYCCVLLVGAIFIFSLAIPCYQPSKNYSTVVPNFKSLIYDQDCVENYGEEKILNYIENYIENRKFDGFLAKSTECGAYDRKVSVDRDVFAMEYLYFEGKTSKHGFYYTGRVSFRFKTKNKKNYCQFGIKMIFSE